MISRDEFELVVSCARSINEFDPEERIDVVELLIAMVNDATGWDSGISVDNNHFGDIVVTTQHKKTIPILQIMDKLAIKSDDSLKEGIMKFKENFLWKI